MKSKLFFFVLVFFMCILVVYAARQVGTAYINIPSGNINLEVNTDFNLTCSYTQTGVGNPASADIYFEFNSSSFDFVNITSATVFNSSNLNPKSGVATSTNASMNISARNIGIYSVRCRIVDTNNAGIANITYNRTIIITDSKKPSINNAFPLNGTFFESNVFMNIPISVSVIDNFILDSVIANITNPLGQNFILLMSNSSGTYNISFANRTLGRYDVSIVANDTSNNINITRLFFYVNDTVFPQIDFGFGTQDDYANVSRNFIYVNVSVVESNFANITFTLKNDNGIVNITTYNGNVFFINFTGLSFGNYIYNVSVYDTALNFNSTWQRNINLSNIFINNSNGGSSGGGSSGGGSGGGGGSSTQTPINTSENPLVLPKQPIEILTISDNQSIGQDNFDLGAISPHIQDLFTQARQDIIEMRGLDIPTNTAYRLFEEAYDSFLKGDYILIESKIKEINDLKQKALIAKDKLSGIKRNPINFLTGAATTAYNNEDFDYVIKNADISNTSSIMVFFSNLILSFVLITFVSRIFVSHYVYSLPSMINKKIKMKQKIALIRKDNKLKINKLNKSIVFLDKKIRKEARLRLIKIQKDKERMQDKIKKYNQKERKAIRNIDVVFKKKEHPYIEHVRNLNKKKSYLSRFIRK